MEKDDRIPPIEAIEKALRVKPIGRIQLFKRPGYLPGERNDSQSMKKAESKEEPVTNRAHSTAGQVGVTIDYRI